MQQKKEVCHDCEGGSCAVDETVNKFGIKDKIKGIFKYAFIDFIDDISLHFVVGVLIAAAITLVIPSGSLS